MLYNALEWYDFAIYGILAATISQVFFPNEAPATSLLAALAIFGVTFVVRPLGAFLIGGLADRKGRRHALLLSAVLMTVGTLMIGLIPSYASGGILSPVLLLVARMLQGLSAGGEFGAANAFLIEWAPPNRRGYWTSFLSLTVAMGSGFASAVVAILFTFLPPEDVADWGWRVPFLLGGFLGLACLWLRNSLEETPSYASARSVPENGTTSLRDSLIVFGITIHWTVCYYMFLIYLPIFMRTYGGMTMSQSVWSNTICTVVIMLAVPVVGSLSDRYGRRSFLAISCLLVILLTFPAFLFIAGGSGFAQVIAVQGLFGVAIASYSGAAPAAVAEQFATRRRSRGTSVPYAMAAAIFGGFAPFISVWLTERFENPMAPVAYVMAASTISLMVVLRMRETGRIPLR